MERQLDPRQVKLVLRRAAELERKPGREEGLSAEDVAEIGHDVGIAPEAVRRALEELRAGVLPAEGEAQGKSLADRVLGPAEVVIERVIPGDLGVIRAEVNRFLEDQVLTVRRNLGDRVIWTRARGVWSAVRRALDVNARLAFAAGTELETFVFGEPGTDRDARQVRVRFVLRVEEARRRRARQALGALAAGVGIAALTLATVHGLAPDLLGCGAGALLAGGATARARRAQQRELGRAEEALQRFLDSLEHERVPALP